MNGAFARGAANSQVTITWEHPSKFRLDETGGRGRALALDGGDLKGRSAVDDDDEDVVETLGLDTAEEFLFNSTNLENIRLLGHRFRVVGETGFGSELDVFEVARQVRGRRDKASRVKRLMFDSATGLLRRTAYTVRKGNRIIAVETVYDNYTLVDGNPLPGLIRRLEDRQEVLRFTRSSAVLSGRANDGLFAQPR